MAATGGGIPVGPLAAIFAAVAGVAVALSKWLPGYATYINILIGAATAISATLTAMGETSPNATLSAILIACVGAILGRWRSETRASG